MSGRAHGPLPHWLMPVARVMSMAYGAAVQVRNGQFDRQGAPARAGVPVISVGNMTAGGTGKTPFVRWCVRELRAAGHSPVVALRGYRSHAGVSDEARELEAFLPGVPVAVGADRARTIAHALANNPLLDCAVLDDAFQHRRLARDLDIVLVDATRPGLDGPLLPAGWLREPAEGLRRAGLVVVTRADRVDAPLAALIERLHGRPPAAWARHAWQGVDVVECVPGCAQVVRSEGVPWLNGRRVLPVMAIGNPAPFLHAVECAGAQIIRCEVRRDHAQYTTADALRFAATAARLDASIVTTWKDWTKLGPALSRAASHSPVVVAVPRVEMEFIAGGERVRAALRAAARGPRR